MKSIADISSQNRTLAEQWIEHRPWLRLATENDCLDKEGLEATRREYGKDYRPYYAAGDFNSDGWEDFAVVLVNQRKQSRRFAIAVFNGPFHGGSAGEPAFFSEGIDLSNGGLIVQPGDLLVIGVFQTDNCVVLWPKGKGYVMEDCS